MDFLGIANLPGEIQSHVLAAVPPIGFWGGSDPSASKTIDNRYSFAGPIASGHVPVILSSWGFCCGTGLPLEVICNRTAPATRCLHLLACAQGEGSAG